MPSNTPSMRPPTVLIASKQEWLGRTLESFLTPRGFIVLKAYTARRALERARQEEPDVIVLDVRLPDADGHDVCRTLREERVVRATTPILIVLGPALTRRQRLAALRAGAWGCIAEPLDGEELLALLGAFVAAKLDADRTRTEGLVDEATGLYNLRGLMRRARELGSLAVRQRSALACVLFAPDPDVEADEGAGEQATQRMASALRSAGRLSDAIGRLGPKEFAVVASGTDGVQARQIAQRLAGAIRVAPGEVGRPAPPLKLRAGVHSVSSHSAAIDTVDLLLRATAALRKARLDPDGGWLRSFDEGDAPATAC